MGMIRSIRKYAVVIVALAITVAVSCTPLAGDDGNARPQETNLQIIQKILGNLAEQILSEASISPGAMIGLQIRHTPESWVTEYALSERIIAQGYKVKYAGDSEKVAPFVLAVGDAGANVKYTNQSRELYFPEKCLRESTGIRYSLTMLLSSKTQMFP
jgi:hypothetical protein